MALSLVQRALALAPQCPVSHLALASLWRDRKDYAEAIREARQALELAPGWGYAQMQLGNLLYEDGQIAEARQEWQKLVDRGPSVYAEAARYNLVHEAKPSVPSRSHAPGVKLRAVPLTTPAET